MDRTEYSIQRSFSLNEQGLVFDKMQVVFETKNSPLPSSMINLVIIAN